MNKKRNIGALMLSRGAMIAALYVALTFVSAIFGLSSGVIQVRFSEMLCILPIFFPEAIPGLFVGCILANTLTGALFFDVVFGSLATLIGAFGAYLLRKIPEKAKWLATLPTVVANGVIIPFVLIFTYGSEDSYFFILLTVSVGELISATIFGSLLYYRLRKTSLIQKI